DASTHIVPIIQEWLFRRLADISKRGKMHDGDRSMATKNRTQAGNVCNLALLKRSPFHCPTMVTDQVVIGNRFKTPLGERFARMATNIARTAGHQDFHDETIEIIVKRLEGKYAALSGTRKLNSARMRALTTKFLNSCLGCTESLD